MAVVTKIFSVSVNGMAYVIGGQNNATITLVRGRTYQFSINAMGHPFWIQTTGNGYNLTSVYTSGVTNNGTQYGTITFTVPENAPDTLFYQCQYHSMMVGQISVTDAQSGQAMVTVDTNSPTLEDLVDKVFYGVRQNRLTGKASIDTITGDEPIRLPDQYSVRADDYVNWMWSYNRFVYSYDENTGHLLMEVL